MLGDLMNNVCMQRKRDCSDCRFGGSASRTSFTSNCHCKEDFICLEIGFIVRNVGDYIAMLILTFNSCYPHKASVTTGTCMLQDQSWSLKYRFSPLRQPNKERKFIWFPTSASSTFYVKAPGGLKSAPLGAVIEPPISCSTLMNAWLIERKSFQQTSSTGGKAFQMLRCTTPDSSNIACI